MATFIVTGSFSRAVPFSSWVNPRIPIMSLLYEWSLVLWDF
jgi:hypothetical protein